MVLGNLRGTAAQADLQKMRQRVTNIMASEREYSAGTQLPAQSFQQVRNVFKSCDDVKEGGEGRNTRQHAKPCVHTQNNSQNSLAAHRRKHFTPKAPAPSDSRSPSHLLPLLPGLPQQEVAYLLLSEQVALWRKGQTRRLKNIVLVSF